MKKLILIILLLFSLSTTVYAHSGGTDAQGGHYDGSDYHYHHGYSAHDHYDMDGDGDLDCPYKFKDNTSSNKSNSNNNKNNQNSANNYSGISNSVSPESKFTGWLRETAIFIASAIIASVGFTLFVTIKEKIQQIRSRKKK